MKIKLEKFVGCRDEKVTMSFLPTDFERFLGFGIETREFTDSGKGHSPETGIMWSEYYSHKEVGDFPMLDDFVKRSRDKTGKYVEIHEWKGDYVWGSTYSVMSIISVVASIESFCMLDINSQETFLFPLYCFFGMIFGILAIYFISRAVSCFIKGKNF